MKRRLSGRVSVAMVAAVTLLPGTLSAQHSLKDQLLGAWSLVTVIGEGPDGSKVEVFGADPKGIIIFTGEGFFSLFQSNAEVPKIAANGFGHRSLTTGPIPSMKVRRPCPSELMEARLQI
jgi:hypothetical protein